MAEADDYDCASARGTCDRDRRQSQTAIEFADRRNGSDRRKSARTLLAQQDHDAAVAVARTALLTFGLGSAEFAAAETATSEARSRLTAAEREDKLDHMPARALGWITPIPLWPSILQGDLETEARHRSITLTLSGTLHHQLTAYAEKHGVTRHVAIRRLLRQALDRN